MTQPEDGDDDDDDDGDVDGGNVCIKVVSAMKMIHIEKYTYRGT